MSAKAQTKIILTANDREVLPFRISLESANRAVGLIALGLPLALLAVGALDVTCAGINSISHYYYSPLGGDILVGALSVIGVLMLFFYTLPKTPSGGRIPVQGYKGHHRRDIWLARLAGLCAFGVALAPTSGVGCEDFGGAAIRIFLTDVSGGELVVPPDVTGTASFDIWHSLGVNSRLLGSVHYASAALMFSILAYYSMVVFTRNQSSGNGKAQPRTLSPKWVRNLIYRVCGVVIIGSLLALVVQFVFLTGDSKAAWNRANGTFWVEAAALFAFGISWSVKGRIFAVLRDRDEINPHRAAVQAAA